MVSHSESWRVMGNSELLVSHSEFSYYCGSFAEKFFLRGSESSSGNEISLD